MYDKILPVEKREGRHRGGARAPGGVAAAQFGSIYLNLPQFSSIWFNSVRGDRFAAWQALVGLLTDGQREPGDLAVVRHRGLRERGI